MPIQLHFIINNENCCASDFSVIRSIYSEVFVLITILNMSRGKRVLFPSMAQLGWSILMDAADLEITSPQLLC